MISSNLISPEEGAEGAFVPSRCSLLREGGDIVFYLAIPFSLKVVFPGTNSVAFSKEESYADRNS
jgi:hypothetical protein